MFLFTSLKKAYRATWSLQTGQSPWTSCSLCLAGSLSAFCPAFLPPPQQRSLADSWWQEQYLHQRSRFRLEANKSTMSKKRVNNYLLFFKWNWSPKKSERMQRKLVHNKQTADERSKSPNTMWLIWGGNYFIYIIINGKQSKNYSTKKRLKIVLITRYVLSLGNRDKRQLNNYYY